MKTLSLSPFCGQILTKTCRFPSISLASTFFPPLSPPPPPGFCYFSRIKSRVLNGRQFVSFCSQKQPWMEFEKAVAERDMAKAFDLLEVIDNDTSASQSTSSNIVSQSSNTSQSSSENIILTESTGRQTSQSDALKSFLSDDSDDGIILSKRVQVEILPQQGEGEREMVREREGSELLLEFESAQRPLRLLDAALSATDMRLVLSAYDWLKSKGLLPSFGSFVPDSSQEQRLVTPKILKASAGLEAKKLSPKKWGSANPLAPILVIGVLSALVNNGIDIRPILVIILSLTIIDAISLGGTGLAQIMSFWKPYRRRVLVHEAGHVVAAYLLGCPVRGVVLDAMQALKMGIQGQAGTQFWDLAMEEELRAGRLTSASIDRYCIVVFAGIAAEAMVYGEAEGGESDENLYKAMVGQLQPVWPPAKISNQARWALLQAFLLLKENRNAHEAVVNALEEGASMGDVAKAIERAMASSDSVK